MSKRIAVPTLEAWQIAKQAKVPLVVAPVAVPGPATPGLWAASTWAVDLADTVSDTDRDDLEDVLAAVAKAAKAGKITPGDKASAAKLRAAIKVELDVEKGKRPKKPAKP